MALDMDTVAAIEDVDQLWQGLQAAKVAADHQLVRAIENRMRELSSERRFVHLSDEELQRQIAGIAGHREPEGMLGHSPGGGSGSGDNGGSEGTLLFNARSRENQHDGIEVTLAGLLAERERRARQ